MSRIFLYSEKAKSARIASPLLLAFFYGEKDIFFKILRHAVDPQEQTLLHFAAMPQHIEVRVQTFSTNLQGGLRLSFVFHRF